MTLLRKVSEAMRESLAVLGLSILCASTAYGAGRAEERHKLQQQQLQDALDLGLQQSGPRADLAPHDRLRLEQLQLRQRMEQSQLEQHQLQLERLSRFRDDPRPALQQHLFAQERQAQIQRFQLEQRDFLRSVPPQPLQRPLPRGRLFP